ncbi:MAG: 2-isopropylmalate synthase [Robiginitomaculum sp.]|nr:2-isopropylmalate synthase [Robiginitomaculum sp.]MDQ7077262.1 2-isopropylmalate synthase [Robiginitomaculum sp.]
MAKPKKTEKANKGRKIAFFDTTLRDGEQAPGFSMSAEEKLMMAGALCDLGVDVIEAGFAAASPGDADGVRRIASEIEGPTICSLSRATENDIRTAGRALEPAGKSRIHIFLGTSPIHRSAKLNMSTDEVLAAIHRSVSLAATHCDEVEFSAEDAIRTEREFLVEALECAAKAGARVLNVPDTVGYTTPDEIYDLFSHLIAKVRGTENAIFSAHCHDDLGMAVANSLAAVRAGAMQVEGAINGIGERAGNCALEEVMMVFATRKDLFNVDIDIDTTKIYPASRMLSKMTGNPVPRNKAIVGRNAFAHEAGIHQHGVLNDRRTYEIMTPEDIGLPGNALILGKHSGKHALAARAKELGFEIDDDRLAAVFTAFKAMADQFGEIADAQLIELISGVTGSASAVWRLKRVEMRAAYGAQAEPFARVELEHPDRGLVTDIATGEGPIHAAFNAVQHITGMSATVEELEINHVGAKGRTDCIADIVLRINGTRFGGRSRTRDVIPAGVEAYVDAINRAAAAQNRDAFGQEKTSPSPDDAKDAA